MKGRRDESREERRDHAVVCRPGADGNQGEHVRAAVEIELPAPLKEWPSAPQNNWSRKEKLKPGRHVVRYHMLQRVSGNRILAMPRITTPNAGPRHQQKRIDISTNSGLISSSKRDRSGLQRHAADRTCPWLGSDHLGMHRAGIFRLGSERERISRLQGHSTFRTGHLFVFPDLGTHRTTYDVRW